jgi:hypothetical protein
MITLGIMQPYFFPYLGYFQLINACDRFVLYDDVAFIKQGWINRNRILVKGEAWQFSIPGQSISSFRHINETMISERPTGWRDKLLKTIEQAYKKAPYFHEIFPLVAGIILDSAGKTIALVNKESIVAVVDKLGLKTKLCVASEQQYDNHHLRSAERVVDICKKEGATRYLNAAGGAQLYKKDAFEKQGIALHFFQMETVTYRQGNMPFVPGLSIIDVMMYNDCTAIHSFLDQYTLL